MTIVSVNFEGVETGTPSVHVPEGDYILEIKKVEQRKAKESGNPCLLFGLKITAGNPKGIGKVIPHNCTLTKTALWNLRNLLEAAGKTIPPKAVKIDLDKLVGLRMAANIIDDEYNGKVKSSVGSFYPVSEYTADPTKKSDEEEIEGEEAETAEETDEEGEELFD